MSRSFGLPGGICSGPICRTRSVRHGCPALSIAEFAAPLGHQASTRNADASHRPWRSSQHEVDGEVAHRQAVFRKSVQEVGSGPSCAGSIPCQLLKAVGCWPAITSERQRFPILAHLRHVIFGISICVKPRGQGSRDSRASAARLVRLVTGERAVHAPGRGGWWQVPCRGRGEGLEEVADQPVGALRCVFGGGSDDAGVGHQD